MNKKLMLLGHLFNHWWMEEVEHAFNKQNLMELITDKGILQGIDEILKIQKETLSLQSCSQIFTVYGDTTTNNQSITLNPSDKVITIGNTDLTEDDLIKIKKSFIFNK